LGPEKFREPDVVFMRKRHSSRIGDRFWKGADLVVEVVSDDAEDRRRDLVVKRAEYAEAGIQEYWIVDPKRKQITVLWLKGAKYQVHGTYGKGKKATSRLLAGFSVDVNEVFAGPTL
jgi:Uma2 family endonuclease